MDIILIALFGGLGGVCRFFLGLKIPMFFGFPLATFFINILGSFILPLWNNYFGNKLKNNWKIAIGTGFIGSFTTFSGLILDVVKMNIEQDYSNLFLYLFLSMAVGIFTSILGVNLANRLEKNK